MDFVKDIIQRLAMPLGIMVGALIATHVLTAIK